MSELKKILVSGATGNLGSAVVEALTSKGFSVVAGSTNTENKIQSKSIETARVIFEDLNSIDTALKGISGLFLMAPPMDPESDLKLIPVIDRAKAAGLEHIVLNTALGVDMIDASPLNRIEKHLKASGMNFTILRPNFFMENFSTGFIAPMIAGGGIFLAADDGKTSFISTKDIAEVAVIAFQKKHFGVEYNLTGPDALDHTQAAKIISENSDKDVKYHALKEEEMLQGARDNGMPEGAVQFMAQLYDAVRNGWMAAVTEDVEKATGKTAISFIQFAQKNRAHWRK